MKEEEYFKIQIEMKLLDGGFYDIKAYKYLNGEGKERWEKDFFNIMWIRESDHLKKSTGKYPTLEANRAWYFKVAMHPELFDEGDT